MPKRCRSEDVEPLPDTTPTFRDQFETLFDEHAPRLRRYLGRLSGDPELAADIVQELFIRLYQRGSLPDTPAPWMISVAMNLFRNAATKKSRRLRLLTPARAEEAHAGEGRSPDHALLAEESRQRVREALATLSDREQRLLLLREEGYSYRELAQALGLSEASVGTLLARARSALKTRYEEVSDAP